MMKIFFVSLLCNLLLISWTATSSQHISDHDGMNNSSLRRRELSEEKKPVEQSALFDYSASPSAAATSECVLINVLVNETSTGEEEQTWLKDSDIPRRVARYQKDGYDKVFVCGNGCGISESEPSSAYRFMGCTLVDASGVLANTQVVGWTSKTEDASDRPVSDTLSKRIHASLQQSMASLPSSIEGIDLLDTCQLLDKKLVFATTENEELLDAILSERGLAPDPDDLGYDLDAIAQWSNVGTPVSS